MSALFNPSSDRPQVWSSGGGTQSAAIAALIIQGRLPRPHHAVIADTGREKTATWEYHFGVVAPALEAIGITLHVAPHSLSSVDLFSGEDGDTIVMPMYSSKGGVLPQHCSNEWKKRVVERWMRLRGLDCADKWIGYSLDEAARRMRREDGPWRPVYPLVELGISRDDCHSIVREMGWPEPPKSSCWMCPWMSDHQWRSMKDTHPRDFTKAVKLQRILLEHDSQAFFHKELRPLEECSFNNQADMLSQACHGECHT